ncbi:hypothetical protein PspLS_00310 [Pyricularia sp. CBS 133598]|nr:hypothetical protein PspLS_00310 [Pyricularia sp. CBS 133598]
MDSLITDQEQLLRSACDRCHAHKVRCSRTVQNESGTGMDEPCSRCLKAQIPCVLGLRGKVGRPAKNMKRKAPSCEDSRHHHHGPDHSDDRSEEQAENLPITQLTMLAALSGSSLERSTDATAQPCLQSPRLYPTPDITPFRFDLTEMDTWEPSSTLPVGLETPLLQSFDFSPFASRDVEPCFQEPLFLTTVRTPVDGDGDMIESAGLNENPTTPFPCLGARAVMDHALDSSSLSNNQCGSVSQTPCAGQQQPATTVPIALSTGTRTSHERLCGISLRISEAAAGFAKDGASASVAALKSVVSLAGELVETARQISLHQAQDAVSAQPSTTENSDHSTLAGEISNGEGGAGGSPFESSAPSFTVCQHASISCTRHKTPGGSIDSTLIFLLLACYAGFLRVFELVLERLWAQYGDPSREDDKTGRGTTFLMTLLETSLAVHTVHCLFKLLREALFPVEPRDCSNSSLVSESGIALISGRESVVKGAGRGTARGLLESTCKDIRQREEEILRSTQELQQRLVRWYPV